MNVGIIVELKLSQEQDVVNQSDDHPETPGTKAGNDPHRK